MFSYITKSLFGKKKVALRVEDCTQWSDPFTVDTIGDMGKVSCKLEPALRPTRENASEKCFSKNGGGGGSNDQLHIGIHISQSSVSLTKIVTFTPYVMAYNGADFNLELKEVLCIRNDMGFKEIQNSFRI